MKISSYDPLVEHSLSHIQIIVGDIPCVHARLWTYVRHLTEKRCSPYRAWIQHFASYFGHRFVQLF